MGLMAGCVFLRFGRVMKHKAVRFNGIATVLRVWAISQNVSHFPSANAFSDNSQKVL